MAAAPPLAPLRLTDIAVNLTDPMFSGKYHGKQVHADDTQAVLARAAAAGVARLILTGTDLDSSRGALALARAVNASGAFPTLRLYSTVGLHPTSAAEVTGAPEAYEAALLAVARDGLADRTVVFIGECGLDFERFHFAPEAAQRAHFPMHLRLARATGLPLFLHDRATQGALLRLIDELGGVPPAGGVVHSFTGSAADLAGALARPQLLVSINGCAMKTAEGCAVAASVPLERLLLETDAPWCGIKPSSPAFAHVTAAAAAPVVKKEKWAAGAMVRDRNEPCNVAQVAQALSALKGVPIGDVCAAAEGNLVRLLRDFL